MKKLILVCLFLIIIVLIVLFGVKSFSNPTWEIYDDYTMRYNAGRFSVENEFKNLKNSNKFLYDGFSLITPVLDSDICYLVSKEEQYLELTALDDCITYDEDMNVVHHYDLLKNGDKKIKLNIDPEKINMIN